MLGATEKKAARNDQQAENGDSGGGRPIGEPVANLIRGHGNSRRQAWVAGCKQMYLSLHENIGESTLVKECRERHGKQDELGRPGDAQGPTPRGSFGRPVGIAITSRRLGFARRLG